jgi:hypothetical protein
VHESGLFLKAYLPQYFYCHLLCYGGKVNLYLFNTP